MGATSDEIQRDLSLIHNEPSLMAWLGLVPNDRESAAYFMAAERPKHVVHVEKAFAIGTTPITTKQFAEFVSETNYKTGACSFWNARRPTASFPNAWSHPNFTPEDARPVVCVTWLDANAYVQWLNRKVASSASNNGPYRLPSEAEWEYAARGGTRTAYWWGNEIGVDHTNCNGCNSAPHFTVPVGEFPPNPFGLDDMLGNASQWTNDCWNASYNGAPADGSSWLSGDCSERVTRGGNWHALPWVSRASTRDPEPIGESWNTIGFRVARDL